MKAPDIEVALDRQSQHLYGLSRRAGLQLGCCVRCRLDVDPSSLSEIDRMEWHLSALCPACYASVTEHEDWCGDPCETCPGCGRNDCRCVCK